MKNLPILILLILAACTLPPNASPTHGASPIPSQALMVEPAPTPTNLALGKPVTASTALPDFPAKMAVDGITGKGEANWWSAGNFSPQWIEIDLGAPASIQEIRLLTSQSPTGKTTHQIWGRGPNTAPKQLHSFHAATGDHEWLRYSPAEPWDGIQYIKIETVESPSWVAWREIEIIGVIGENALVELAPPSVESADIIFYQGSIVTMDAKMTIGQALAVKGDSILAVGSDAEILAIAGANTQMINLNGRTVMPGIVDAHTHILNDAEGHLGLDLHLAQQLALENGITTLANMFVTADFLAQMRALEAAGEVRVRTSLYLIATNNCGEIQGDWYKQHAPTRNFGEMLRIGGVKIFADGGSCGEPAVSEEWYYGYGLGNLWLTQEQMDAAVAAAHTAGYQVVIHAIGDRAIDQALNALEAALHESANTLRHRIDHNVVIRPEMLARYGEIGVIPAVFGYKSTCSLEGITPFYEANAWNWRALLDANPGLPVAWHGDDPWVGPINPFLELHSMVTRTQVAADGSLCEPPAWLANGAVTVVEGLRMMTNHAAYALFRETEVGSLEPGKLADLLIISANPLTIDPNEIRNIQIGMTMVGGVSQYCAPGQEAFCPK
ncbi:MAG: amidohydrolase family protein [Anaerolineae bacterium]|nr:amidohydrolase family protein [Anaerolineae bacterium]